jgi:cell division septum initiation protein DivIVA
MFGKNDVVDNLSRDLDHARGRRDALASDVSTLSAQIAEIEARLSEEKNRRESERVLGEIGAIKKQIKQTASALAPLIGKLCEATERAAAIVPEARALDSFLLSVATEVDSVIDPLLRELDRRADEVRLGHAALDLPCLANEAPTELPKDNNDRLLRFPIWLASLPACVELARHRLLNIAMIRHCASGMIGLCGGARDNKPSPIAAP